LSLFYWGFLHWYSLWTLAYTPFWMCLWFGDEFILAS
jgi:hypothetical protein